MQGHRVAKGGSRGAGAVPSGSEGSAGAELFAALFAEAEPTLRAVAAGVTGRPALVEDVVQDAALIGLKKFDAFTEGTSFGAWMAKIVRLTALNAARRARRSAGVGIDPETLPICDDRPAHREGDQAFDRKGRFPEGERLFDDRVLRALDQLEETPRVCLLLRVLHDAPYREISRMLEIPEGTAMSHVHRARASLRAALSDGPQTSAGAVSDDSSKRSS